MSVHWGGRGFAHVSRTTFPGVFVGGGEPSGTLDTSISAPALTLATAYNTYPPTVNAALDDTVAVGDSIEAQYTTDVRFGTYTALALHTITSGEAAANAASIGFSAIVSGTNYIRERIVQAGTGNYSNWSNTIIQGAVTDSTPDAFSFTDQTNVALSSTITSAAVQLTGFNQPVAISVAGGEYATSPDNVTYSAFTSSVGTVYPNDYVKARNTSSASNSTPTNTTVTAGGVSDTFTSTTLAATVSLPTSGMTTRQDADSASTLFQTIDGSTTPVAADGDLVGYWGAGSGTGFHLAAAANDTTRPTWKANAGLPYVLGDGVNDILKRAAPLGLKGNAYTVAVAMKTTGLPAASNLVPFAEGRSSVSTNPVYAPLASQSGNSNVVTWLRNDAGTTYSVSGTVDADAFDGNDTVLLLTHDGSGTLICYEDGDTTGATKTYTPSTTTVDVFALFGLQRASASSWLPCAIYAFAAWNRVLNSTERAQVRTYMGAKQGRLL